MKILSLFDGMACGMLAMIGADILVDRYVAYEVDKYAVKTSVHNFPEIEQKGDVFNADFTEYEGFDFLVGGSPCTYWSIAQTKNRETTASGMGWELFSQYVRALHEVKPKYFIYENNKSMSKAIRESITDTFGFEPICINSALLSAQNRQRLYWVGIRNENGTYQKVTVEQPEDKGILLKDILETNGMPYQNKADVLTASYNGAVIWNSLERHQRSMIAEPVNCTSDGKASTLMAGYYKYGMATPVTNNGFKGGANCVAEPVCVAQRGRNPKNPTSREPGIPTEQRFEARTDKKTNTITTVQKDNLVAEPIRAMNYELESVKNSDSGVIATMDMPGSHDILKKVYGEKGKSPTINTCGGGNREPKVFTQLPECFRVKEATKQGYTDIEPGNCVDMAMINSKTRRGRNMETKSNCLQTNCSFFQYCGTVKTPIYEVKDGMITVKGKQYPIKLIDGYYIIRKLTVRECMRLQTVPEWYEFPVSNSQAYKMLGNGWTIDVIVHLLKSIK